MQPGTEIVAEDGEYIFNQKLNISAKGNKCQPVIIKAKNVGKAVITKGEVLFKNATWLTFEGFTFNTPIKNAYEDSHPN